MGRPGSGRPSVRSSGSTHRVSSRSSGSMHRVGSSSSRPSMSTRTSFSSSRPKRSTGSVGGYNPKPAWKQLDFTHDESSYNSYNEPRCDERRMSPMPVVHRSTFDYHTPPKRTTIINNTYIDNSDTVKTYSRSSDDDSYDYNSRGYDCTDDSDGDEGSNISTIIGVIGILMIIGLAICMLFGKKGADKQESLLERVRLETGYSYMNDCVDDELGWLNASYVSKGMKQFYEDTGAQPYIWLRAYDGVDWTDDEEYDIATRYYDDAFADRQDVVLFVYFEEADPNEVGNMALIHGTQSGAIMDSEAEEIFWNYLDSAWESYGEDETDDMFIHIFNQTGNSIMYHSTNGYDVAQAIMILCSVVAVVVAVIVAIKEINKRKKEKAEETERILKTSLDNLADEKADDLLEKYRD